MPLIWTGQWPWPIPRAQADQATMGAVQHLACINPQVSA
jgi:hypothetical protein